MARYVIFGAYGAVGSALAHLLAVQGNTLLLAGRNAEKLSALAQEIDADTASAEATDSASIEAAIATAVERLGGIDGIANCFGSVLLKPGHVTTDAELESLLAVNLKSSFSIMRGAAKHIPGAGSVVFFSSAAAQIGLVNHEAIAAAKAAVQGLMLSAAATYAKRSLRFNCVSPGLLETPLTAHVVASPAAADASLRMHALGRFGKPEEVARAAAFLLSPDQGWITGQVLGVDGGLGSLWSRGNAAK